ncbi:MAG: hypothetical protein ACRD4O_12230 [Bryobacteraceae bacterium]
MTSSRRIEPVTQRVRQEAALPVPAAVAPSAAEEQEIALLKTRNRRLVALVEVLRERNRERQQDSTGAGE